MFVIVLIEVKNVVLWVMVEVVWVVMLDIFVGNVLDVEVMKVNG